MASSVELDTRVLDGIIKNLDGNVEDNIRAVGFSIEGKAKVNAPIDTGALRNSIYTRTYDRDEISKVRATVGARNSDAEVTSLPRPENSHVVHVGPSVNYSMFVEFGTRFQTGQPFLQPAVRGVERDLINAMRDAVTDGRK